MSANNQELIHRALGLSICYRPLADLTVSPLTWHYTSILFCGVNAGVCLNHTE